MVPKGGKAGTLSAIVFGGSRGAFIQGPSPHGGLSPGFPRPNPLDRLSLSGNSKVSEKMVVPAISSSYNFGILFRKRRHENDHVGVRESQYAGPGTRCADRESPGRRRGPGV